MPVDDDLSARLRAATTDLQSAPIRLERVAHRARLRLLLAVVATALMGIIAVTVVSAGLLAGKAAVDSTYRPPLGRAKPHAKISVGFGEPDAARGHTRLEDYLRAARRSPAGFSARELRSEGFLFDVRVELKGYSGAVAKVDWSVFDVESGRPRPLPRPVTDIVRPRSDSEVDRLGIWVPYPARAGKFAVRFRLIAASGRVLRTQVSAPFIVLRQDFFRPLTTPIYRARIPDGWKVVRRHEDEPGGRFVTTARGPGGQGLTIDAYGWEGSPAAQARYLEPSVLGQAGYRRLAFAHGSLGNGSAFEWAFRVGDEPVYKTDILFRRGGDGFAVMTEGSAEQFSFLRAVARAVARSVDPR